MASERRPQYDLGDYDLMSYRQQRFAYAGLRVFPFRVKLFLLCVSAPLRLKPCYGWSLSMGSTVNYSLPTGRSVYGPCACARTFVKSHP